MIKHHQIITTSEIDDNYFIINSGNFYIIELIQLLNKRGLNVSNILTPTITNPLLINKKIFITKDSVLGIELTKLINEQQLIEEKRMIRESYLYNALIKATLNKEEQIYIDLISTLIKEKEIGSIDNLKSKHFEKLLERISYDGRQNNYVKEEIINGFETEGITYQDNEWQPIKLTPKNRNKVYQKKVLPN